MSFDYKLKNKNKKIEKLQVQKPRIRKSHRMQGLASHLKGSLAAEASLVLPLFMFAVIFVITFAGVINSQLSAQLELDSRVRKTSRISAVAEDILDTDIYEQITLWETHELKLPFFERPGRKDAFIHAEGRAWIGAHLLSELSDDEIVYITPTGSVYHRKSGCSHLALSISSISASEVKAKRNNSGEKYHKCEICGKQEASDTLYITSYGDRYHLRRDCSGLKRTIIPIRLSAVGTKGPCQRCG